MNDVSPPTRQRSVAIIGTRGYPSYYGGFETAVRKLAPFLSERDWDVTVYGRENSTRTDDPGVDPRVRAVQTWGVNNKSFSTLSYGLSACLDTLRRKPDVALVMNVANGFWLPLLRLRGIPTVVNVDGIEWQRAKWGRLAKAMFRLGAILTARFGNSLVFDAKAIESFWKNEFRRTGTFIPYGGESVDQLSVEPGLKSGEYVLLVARFVPENTIEEFFGAAEILAASGLDIIIVGSSGNGGELDERAQTLSDTFASIQWFGHISDDDRLFSLWQHAGAYFHGHSVGGTNPALVQAMACGAPIVARDTIYNREVLADTGVFVDADAEAIASSIAHVVHSSDDQTEAMVDRASRHYNWQSVCAAYERTLLAQISGSK